MCRRGATAFFQSNVEGGNQANYSKNVHVHVHTNIYMQLPRRQDSSARINGHCRSPARDIFPVWLV